MGIDASSSAARTRPRPTAKEHLPTAIPKRQRTLRRVNDETASSLLPATLPPQPPRLTTYDVPHYTYAEVIALHDKRIEECRQSQRDWEASDPLTSPRARRFVSNFPLLHSNFIKASIARLAQEGTYAFKCKNYEKCMRIGLDAFAAETAAVPTASIRAAKFLALAGDATLQMQDYKEAASLYAQAFAVHQAASSRAPISPSYWLNAAYAHLNLKHYTSVLNLYERLFEAQRTPGAEPFDNAHLEPLGFAYYHLDRFSEAAAQFAKAAAANVHAEEYAQATIQYDFAIHLCLKASPPIVVPVDYWIKSAEVKLLLDKFEEGAEHMEHAAQAYLQLFNYETATTLYDQTIHAYQKAFPNQPIKPNCLTNAVIANIQRGNKGKALLLCDEALAACKSTLPEQPILLRYLKTAAIANDTVCNYSIALAFFEEYFALHERICPAEQIPMDTLMRAVNIATKLELKEKTIALLEQAAKTNRESPNTMSQIRFLTAAGKTCYEFKECERTVVFLEEAFALYRTKLKETLIPAAVLSIAAMAYFKLKDYKRASRFCALASVSHAAHSPEAPIPESFSKFTAKMRRMAMGS